jgi:hypothetical protein
MPDDIRSALADFVISLDDEQAAILDELAGRFLAAGASQREAVQLAGTAYVRQRLRDFVRRDLDEMKRRGSPKRKG